jgi:hypothetical protein
MEQASASEANKLLFSQENTPPPHSIQPEVLIIFSQDFARCIYPETEKSFHAIPTHFYKLSLNIL